MKPAVRILITLACGFGVAMLFMAVAIYFGYSNAYRQGADTSEVYMFGLNIYHLTLSGEKYAGTSNGPAMGGVCAIVKLKTGHGFVPKQKSVQLKTSDGTKLKMMVNGYAFGSKMDDQAGQTDKLIQELNLHVC